MCTSSAAELETEGKRIIWLPCCHRASVECYQKYIEQQDALGKEPTCLTCAARTALPLDDASIRQILGEEAHGARLQRLLHRAPGLMPCPTPDCSGSLGTADFVEDGLEERLTTCPRCKKVARISRGPGGAFRVASFQRRASAAAAPRAATPPAPAPASAPSSAAGRPSGSGSAADPCVIGDSESGSDTAEDGPLVERKRRREEEEASEAALRQFRACPQCGQGLEKTQKSCNKFQCRCGYRFCWKCGKPADIFGKSSCRCTGDEHVFWDNKRNRPTR